MEKATYWIRSCKGGLALNSLVSSSENLCLVIGSDLVFCTLLVNYGGVCWHIFILECLDMDFGWFMWDCMISGGVCWCNIILDCMIYSGVCWCNIILDCLVYEYDWSMWIIMLFGSL
jgi:hypothetical protein